MPSVFISYSHDSDAHRDFLRGIADRLRQDGVDCLIDQYINGFPPEGWQRWMENQIEAADFILLVCTETYLRRFRGQETQGGKGVNFEGVVISQVLHDNYYKNTRFIPVIPDNGEFSHVPLPLRPYTTYRLDSQYEDVYRIVTNQTKYQQPELGEIHQLPDVHTEPPCRIYSDDLPTVEGELFGRKDELALLDQALIEPTTNIVQFVASGGTGKTKLIRTWLDNNTDKIDNLIAWSFYSQGSSEDKQISATPFFMQALKSLGSDKDISDFNTEEEKGEHIADLLRAERCLLVLDGLEPLQQVGRGMRGELKDRAIRKLLRCLVGSHSSLCIITTRLPVHELKGRRQVVQHDLQNLAPEDGVALLRSFGVSGRDADMLTAVEEYGRHALALHLLGNALATYLDGDVRKRDTLGELIGDYDEVERHAFKVMQAYERWLEGTVELKLLYLLGLFDHPVEQEVLEVLWEAEIPGLTAGVDRRAWLVAQRDLISKYRMMAETVSLCIDNGAKSEDKPLPSPPLIKGGSLTPVHNSFDCHPLIREYFGRQLKVNQGEVWRQAHTVLYEYYKGLPEKLWGKYLPDTLEEMQPLFRAVMHGCFSGNHEDSYYEIYLTRILREDRSFFPQMLGAYSQSLSLVSNFFLEDWKGKFKFFELDFTFQATSLNNAGLNLRALGRLSESIIPFKKALTATEKTNDLIGAASAANNLCEVSLISGYVAQAKAFGKLSVSYADDSEDNFAQRCFRTTYAEVLHKAGKIKPALGLFRKAERMHKKHQPSWPLMYGMQGFRYCDLLLDLGQVDFVISYVAQTLDWGKGQYSPLSVSLDQLMLGKAYFIKGKNNDADFWLKKAESSSRTSETLHYLPLSLLSIAILKTSQSDFSTALSYLEEIYEISEPSGMRLHLTDYHLEMARLILAVEADPTQYPEATPDRDQRTLPFADQEEPGILTLQDHIAEADRLIQETGYHRRDAELAELKQTIGEQ